MRTSTCGSDGQWNPDPEEFLCPTISVYIDACMQMAITALYIEPPVTCPVPEAPSNGSVNTNDQSYTEGSQVTYQCNDGLFPTGVLIATCTSDGQNKVWEPDPSAVVCRTSPGTVTTHI